MTFNEWINAIMSNGMLCSEYTDKVKKAFSKKQLMDIVMDANGLNYLAEMEQRGYPLPYETILKEFNGYINGRYTYESKPNQRGHTYTTEIYCCYNDEDHIDVNTTAISLLGCKTTLNIDKFKIVSIYLDTNCDVKINCPEMTSCNVYKYGNAKVDYEGSVGKVKVIEFK